MKNILISVFDITMIPKLIWRYRDLLMQLIRRNLYVKYQGAALGLFWSVLQPLLMLSVYTFVFTFVFTSKFGAPGVSQRTGSFAIIMFCGMSIFTMFSEGVNSCSTLLISNVNLVKKVIFPLELLPVAQVVSAFIFGLINFVLLFIGCCFFLDGLSWTMLLLPLTLFPLLLFSCGIGFFVASLGVYVRDLPHLIGIVLQILFFMTPIFYPISAIPGKFRIFLYVNPLCELIEETRMFFLYGQVPNWFYVCLVWCLSVTAFQLGLVWFVKTKKGFADVL